MFVSIAFIEPIHLIMRAQVCSFVTAFYMFMKSIEGCHVFEWWISAGICKHGSAGKKECTMYSFDSEL